MRTGRADIHPRDTGLSSSSSSSMPAGPSSLARPLVSKTINYSQASFSIASSAIWLIITAVLWGVAAGLYKNERGGGMCEGEAAISRCRQTQTVEALAWTEMGLCILTLFAACFWMRRSKRSYRNPYYV
ncbi:hypothetical protein PIIN_11344 [Serendipita indica DSM 11827]|uniref:MARVEL domain-containing protein n=1 Tax=Serendipita indica (strain DSM 11827) TaxID=1109443 RepID=G4U1C4_SERID|nr:hypothetical protein PIIN_11344 [Serendipita indica DSM 11827]